MAPAGRIWASNNSADSLRESALLLFHRRAKAEKKRTARRTVRRGERDQESAWGVWAHRVPTAERS